MKTIRKSVLIAAAFFCAITFAVAGSAFAWGIHSIDHENAWGKDFTPEQWTIAQKILEKNWSGTSDTRIQLSAKYAEIKAALSASNPDSKKIESLSREIGELRGKILQARVNTREELEKQGLPSDYLSGHGMRGHSGSWHIGSYGPGHRMNRGECFNRWNN